MPTDGASRRPIRILAIAIGTAIGVSVFVWAVFAEFRGIGDLGRAMLIPVIYTLPLLGINVAITRPLERWADRSRFPWNWAVLAAGQLAACCGAAAVASAVMLLTGLVRMADLYLMNRLAILVPLTLLLFIRLYGSTKLRLEERARVLEEQVADERRALDLHLQDSERAREIQEALMPKQLPQIQGCDLAAGWQPARIVGGDYYDAIRLSETSAALAIGDVSGKGMGAALLMSNLQAIVRAFASTGLSAAELCSKANRLVAGNIASGKFITFFYAVADLAGMRLDYCRAGHNPPLLTRRNGAIERLMEGGPVLGVFPNASYPAGIAELKPGDRLVLFTDGITEAMNGAGEEFGEERLIALLTESNSAGAEELRARIMAAVAQFTAGTFQDDATLLIAAFAGTS